MENFKELSIYGDEAALEEFASGIESFFPIDWIKSHDDYLEDFIAAEYIGRNAPHARLTIHCNEDDKKNGHLCVGNILSLDDDKDKLTISEYNGVIDQFYNDIVKPYADCHNAIRVDGPTSGVFDPLCYITTEALEKLRSFYYCANKTTGSSHPCDEKRWFDFVIQTVEDGRTLDYNTFCRFLTDGDFWRERGLESTQSTWSDENAEELAMEYDNYVRFLQYYLNSKTCD